MMNSKATTIDDDRGRTARRQKIAGIPMNQQQANNAERFARIHDRAKSDDLKAIDYSALRVDGGRGHPVGENARWHAAETLRRIEDTLGPQSFLVLQGIAAEGRTVADVAEIIRKSTGESPKIMRGYVSIRYREILDQLSTLLQKGDDARSVH